MDGTNAPDELHKWPDLLVLMRHAESRANVRRAVATTDGALTYGEGVRDADVPLTERGFEQAARTARLCTERFGSFDVALVSPYRRTQETLDTILAEMERGGAPLPRIYREDRLRERDFGIATGLTPAGFTQRFPDETARRALEGRYYYRPPGGESYPDVGLRVHALLGTLVREHARRKVLIVTHAVVLLMFRKLLEHLDEGDVLRVLEQDDIENCGLCVYRQQLTGGRVRLVLESYNLCANGVRAQPQTNDAASE